MTEERLKLINKIAEEMVWQAKGLKKRNPNKNLLDIITPDWRKYINNKIKQLWQLIKTQSSAAHCLN